MKRHPKLQQEAKTAQEAIDGNLAMIVGETSTTKKIVLVNKATVLDHARRVKRDGTGKIPQSIMVGSIVTTSLGQGTWKVVTSAALKGYGTLIYTAMMTAVQASGGGFLASDVVVSESAMRLWGKFHNNPSEYEKAQFSKDEEQLFLERCCNAAFELPRGSATKIMLTDMYHKGDRVDLSAAYRRIESPGEVPQEEKWYLGTLYKYQPTQSSLVNTEKYTKLLKSGFDMCEQCEVLSGRRLSTEEAEQEILSSSHKFFNSKYYE